MSHTNHRGREHLAWHSGRRKRELGFQPRVERRSETISFSRTPRGLQEMELFVARLATASPLVHWTIEELATINIVTVTGRVLAKHAS